MLWWVVAGVVVAVAVLGGAYWHLAYRAGPLQRLQRSVRSYDRTLRRIERRRG